MHSSTSPCHTINFSYLNLSNSNRRTQFPGTISWVIRWPGWATEDCKSSLVPPRGPSDGLDGLQRTVSAGSNLTSSNRRNWLYDKLMLRNPFLQSFVTVGASRVIIKRFLRDNGSTFSASPLMDKIFFVYKLKSWNRGIIILKIKQRKISQTFWFKNMKLMVNELKKRNYLLLRQI